MDYFQFGQKYNKLKVNGKIYQGLGLGKFMSPQGNYLLIEKDGQVCLVEGRFSESGIECKM